MQGRETLGELHDPVSGRVSKIGAVAFGHCIQEIAETVWLFAKPCNRLIDESCRIRGSPPAREQFDCAVGNGADRGGDIPPEFFFFLEVLLAAEHRGEHAFTDEQCGLECGDSGGEVIECIAEVGDK